MTDESLGISEEITHAKPTISTNKCAFSTSLFGHFSKFLTFMLILFPLTPQKKRELFCHEQMRMFFSLFTKITCELISKSKKVREFQ